MLTYFSLNSGVHSLKDTHVYKTFRIINYWKFSKQLKYPKHFHKNLKKKLVLPKAFFLSHTLILSDNSLITNRELNFGLISNFSSIDHDFPYTSLLTVTHGSYEIQNQAIEIFPAPLRN